MGDTTDPATWACPLCRAGMRSSDSGGPLRNWVCGACGMGWVPGDSIAAYLPGVQAFATFRRKAIAGEPSTRPLCCPSCRAESFHVMKAGRAELDVCVKCVGVALDPGELKAVQSLRNSPTGAVVDTVYGIDAIAHFLSLFL